MLTQFFLENKFISSNIFSGNLADYKQHISQTLESLSTGRGSFSRVWKACRLYATGFPECEKLADCSRRGIFSNKWDVSQHIEPIENPVFTGVNKLHSFDIYIFNNALCIALYSNQYSIRIYQSSAHIHPLSKLH